MKRIQSIDIVRGLVMVIMALDHVRDLMHFSSTSQNPLDLGSTSLLLFFTRWITHLCAPSFVLLAGVSVYLAAKKQNDRAASRRFLISRGLWLILLEFTVINFGLWLDPAYHLAIFEVIGAFGLGFICLALLLNLSPRTLGIIGLTIMATHNLLPLLPLPAGSPLLSVLTPLFGPTTFTLAPGHILIIGYAPIPWIGIMLLGFGLGPLFEYAADKREKIFFRLGLLSLSLFILIRAVNIYGDPVPWKSQHNFLYSFLSFINVNKYPPSLLFCLLMLGLMFLLLGAAEKAGPRLSRFLMVYGRVPLFYFLTHWYLMHAILIFILLGKGYKFSELDFSSGTFGRPGGQGGVGLGYIYLIWISVVLLMYFPCRWYGNYKAGHSNSWLKYL